MDQILSFRSGGWIGWIVWKGSVRVTFSIEGRAGRGDKRMLTVIPDPPPRSPTHQSVSFEIRHPFQTFDHSDPSFDKDPQIVISGHFIVLI